MCSSEGIKLGTATVFPQADVLGFKMAALQICKNEIAERGKNKKW